MGALISDRTRRNTSKVFFFFNMVVFFLLPMNGKIIRLLGGDSPFNPLPVALIVLFVLCFFTSAFDFRKVIKNKFFKLFAAFFGCHLVSSLLSVGLENALDEVSKKISYIAIPIIVFSNAGFFVRNAKKMFNSFFLGIAFTLIILDCYGIAEYVELSKFPFYVGYSKMLHPSYLGVNVVLLILINLYRFGEEKLSWKNYIYHLFLLFFLLFHLFVLLSKGVIIVAGISMVAYLVVLMQKNFKKGFAYLSFWLLPGAIFCAVAIGHTGFHDSVFDRFSDLQAYDQESGSTSFRTKIIKKSPEILEGNWFLGVGSGKETEYLNSYYEKTEWVYARYYSYNMHNQYLQTCLGIGLGGVFLLLILVFGPFVLSIDPVIKIMLFCFGFLFCTEAMLERQAGIVLFVFFYCVFIGLTRPRKMKVRKRVLTFD